MYCFRVTLRGEIQFQVTLTKQDVVSSLTGALLKNFRQAHPCIYFFMEIQVRLSKFSVKVIRPCFSFNISGGVGE